jgi:N-acetylmuramoyl-L-alanine amidase
MTRRPIAGVLTFAVLTTATLVWAQTTVQATFHSPSGDHPVATLQKAGETFFSVDDVITALGGKVTPDSGGARIVLGGLQAAVGPDSRFAVVRDDLIDMPQPPLVVEGKVYLPLRFFQSFLHTAAQLDTSWDPAAHLLSVRAAAQEPLTAQLSVVNLQNTSKLVIQLSGVSDFTIARTPGLYTVHLRNPIHAAVAEQTYDDPRVQKITVHDSDVVVELRSPDVAADFYKLENPYRIVIDLREGAPQLPSGTLPLPSEPRSQERRGVRTIVLDAGHGGRDVGAVGPQGLQEKDLTLVICRKLASQLGSKLGVRVILTRNSDEVVTLEQRTALANQYKADLFLSVHLNASVMKGARGSETYFLSVEASDELARKAAERENLSLPQQAPPPPSSDLRLMLWDLAQQEYLKESSRFADIIQEEMNQAVGIQGRGVKQAPFKVLVGASMPAALVELGFISNPEEEAKLVDDTFQNSVASTLEHAVERYKAEYESRLGIVPPASPALGQGEPKPPATHAAEAAARKPGA